MSALPELPYTQAQVPSFDGTLLTYRVYGDRPDWVVIANGYGGTFNAWAGVLPHLTRFARVLLWDYRGTHASAKPASADALRVEDHARDLERLLGHLGITRFVLVGWSVGVQVALEIYRRHPEAVRSMLLHNGAHERILHRALGGGAAAWVLPWLVPALATVAGPVSAALRPALRAAARAAVRRGVFERLGVVVGRPANLEAAADGLLSLDMGLYLRMAALADRHQTEDWLDEVGVPVLITAGDRDGLTPESVARRVVERVPQGRLFTLSRATHYALMEYPALLAELIREAALAGGAPG